jgi:hypothetical protein
MPPNLLKCSFCKKPVYRDNKRINEGKKFNWKVYCSLKCLGLSKRKSTKFICANSACRKIFWGNPNSSRKSKSFYCSRRCAAIVNNQKYPKNPGITKTCIFCGKKFKSREKFCSKRCKDKAQIISKKEVINFIKDFFNKTGRIPFKREHIHVHAARSRFGNWNNAIKAAGFDPNPVMFANKHLAKDGHKCDSFSEKIIDDWLFENKIKHKKNISYPGNKGFTCDFVIGNQWVEFFGLHGEHKRYDDLRRRKLNLVKKYNLDFIDIYPKDIFPITKLEKIFNFNS